MFQWKVLVSTCVISKKGHDYNTETFVHFWCRNCSNPKKNEILHKMLLSVIIFSTHMSRVYLFQIQVMSEVVVHFLKSLNNENTHYYHKMLVFHSRVVSEIKTTEILKQKMIFFCTFLILKTAKGKTIQSRTNELLLSKPFPFMSRACLSAVSDTTF